MGGKGEKKREGERERKIERERGVWGGRKGEKERQRGGREMCWNVYTLRLQWLY